MGEAAAFEATVPDALPDAVIDEPPVGEDYEPQEPEPVPDDDRTLDSEEAYGERG